MARDNFMEATRRGLRFESNRGFLSVEDLWGLNLEDLDKCYQIVSSKLKKLDSGESLLRTTNSKDTEDYEISRDVIKEIFEIKEREIEERKAEKSRAEKKQAMLAILADKENEDLRNLSKDELLRRIQEL